MIKLTSTPHAIQRARERAGWGRRTLDRMLERIFYDGLGASDCRGFLGEYLAVVKARDVARFARVHGEFVFIFARERSPDEVALVTVLNLPGHLRDLATRLRARRRVLSA